MHPGQTSQEPFVRSHAPVRGGPSEFLRRALPAAFLSGLLAVLRLDGAIETGPLTVRLDEVASGLVSPIYLTHAGDGSGRLFVVDQVGKILVIKDGNVLPAPFLDLTSKIVSLNEGYDERGLLGLAFHPAFATNGRFFVRYSAPRQGDPSEPCSDPAGFIVGCHKEVLAEYRVSSGDPDVADPTSEVILFEVDKPQFNHDGGQVAFGPDGLLYFSLGDGGGANDGLADDPPSHGPIGNGQNIETPLGAVLRVDVDGPLPLGIPPDNPFVGKDGLDTIFAYGFRNPYRFSFDRETGELLVADVGQNLFEEIDSVTAGGNYGWAIREGRHCFDPFQPNQPPPTCSTEGLIDPFADYDHSEGLAVVGGYVYRGTRFPELAGKYLFGDYTRNFQATGRLFYLDAEGDRSTILELGRDPASDPGGLFVKGFGEDEDGEVYLLASTELGLAGTTGKVYHIAPKSGPSFRRGDSNADGEVNLSDAIHVLGYLFLGTPESLPCREASDTNGDGKLDLTDAVFALGYLFLGQAAPPAPGPDVCGSPASLLLDCASYPACGSPPAIASGPTAAPSELDEGQSTSLSVTASDPEGGALTFSWIQTSPESPQGTFSTTSSSTPTWTAPKIAAATVFTLHVVVTDSSGQKAEADVLVTVNDLNLPPAINVAPSATPSTTLPGEKVTLSVTAEDPDGDPLTYAWVQTDPAAPQGQFVSGVDAASASWRSPPLSAETSFTFQVSVSDGTAPPVTDSVTLTVGLPAYGADIQPIFTQNCSCHQGNFPSAGMSLDAGNSYANLVNVAATACAPLLRVLPGDPDSSVLVRKISGSTCGARMPFNNPGFFDTNPNLLIRIRSWVLSGAPDN